MPPSIRRFQLGTCALLLLAACSGGQATRPTTTPSAVTSARVVYPGASWSRVSPDSAGFSSTGLDSVKAYLGTISTTGAMVVASGRVVFEYGNIEELSYLASARKSVLAMLYGNYVANGTIRLNRSLKELGIDDLTDQERAATIKDLLGARSGVYHAASNPGDNLADAPPRGSQKHGTYYLYSNWDFNALGTIFEQETGRNIYDALETDLARPLAFQDWNRPMHQRSGDTTRSIHKAYHMNLSTRDMARLGYLMLRGGRWEGRRIVPQDWVRRITTPVTRWNEMNPAFLRGGRFGYGLLWWIFDGPTATGAYAGAYSAMGAVGQYITVLPALDLVVVHKTKPGEGRSVTRDQWLAFLERVVRARGY
jgi:CubicO group peptidase (beta-lactamase class C family)